MRLLFRRRSLQQLTAIRYSQVPNAESPRNFEAWRKARMNASWVASRASPRSPHMRTARAKMRSSCRRMSSGKAPSSPAAKARRRSSSERGSLATEGDLRDRCAPGPVGQFGYPDEPVLPTCRLLQLDDAVSVQAVLRRHRVVIVLRVPLLVRDHDLVGPQPPCY